MVICYEGRKGCPWPVLHLSHEGQWGNMQKVWGFRSGDGLLSF